MKFYLDITLLPDEETDLGFLWQKVYQQVHLSLVENKQSDNSSLVAISFPQYGETNFPLGGKLRLLAGNAELLERLDLARWLTRLVDYCHTTSIKPVPTNVKYMQFRRNQFNSNVHRLARRRAKRKGETVEESLNYFASFKDEQTRLPYINMQSLSKDKKFKLFIKKESAEQEQSGEFNCFGLSKTATTPWF